MKVFIRAHRLPPLVSFVLLTVLVAVSLGVLGGHALASGPWASQSSGTNNSLNGIVCPGTTTCFAVGASGTIVATTNGGSTSWTIQGSGITTNSLNGITCLSTINCYVVGAASGGGNATILNYNGSTWMSQNSNTPQNLNGITCLSASPVTCFAVGALFNGNGSILVLTTTDGSTWTSQNTKISGTSSLNSIACPNTGTCFAVGAGGLILALTTPQHGSPTWASQTSNTTNSLNGIACLSTTNCFAVGAGGTILSYNGTTWASQTSNTTNSLNAVACPSTSACFAAGISGTILSNVGSLTESGGIATTATPVTLNGTNHTTTYALGVTVSDTTGSGTGWKLMITSTTLIAGSHTLSTTASTINAAPTAVCVGSCTLPSISGVSYPFTIPAGSPAPTALKYFNAAANSGMGTMTVTATVSVAIPANAFSGTYSSTLTVVIASGP